MVGDIMVSDKMVLKNCSGSGIRVHRGSLEVKYNMWGGVCNWNLNYMETDSGVWVAPPHPTITDHFVADHYVVDHFVVP